MKAVVHYGPYNMRIEEIATPKAGEKQVLVQVKACGVCGSDRHLFQGRMKFDVEGVSIFGHEFAGVISEVGEGVTLWQVGDRVAVNPNLLCGKCYFCQRGQENFCKDRHVLGGDLWGGFAEYCVVDEKLLYHLPEKVSFLEATLSEPLSCCLNGMFLTDIKAGDTVMIIGSGGIGLLMIQLAKIQGAGTIIVCEPNDARRALAMRFGALIGFNPTETTIEEVVKMYGIENIDVAIECVGAHDTIKSAYDVPGRGTKIMIFGTPAMDDEVPVDTYDMFCNEKKIMATYINPYTFGRVLELLKSKRIDLSEHVKTVVPLSEIMDCFTTDKYRDAAKMIIVP